MLTRTCLHVVPVHATHTAYSRSQSVTTWEITCMHACVQCVIGPETKAPVAPILIVRCETICGSTVVDCSRYWHMISPQLMLSDETAADRTHPIAAI